MDPVDDDNNNNRSPMTIKAYIPQSRLPLKKRKVPKSPAVFRRGNEVVLRGTPARGKSNDKPLVALPFSPLISSKRKRNGEETPSGGSKIQRLQVPVLSPSRSDSGEELFAGAMELAKLSKANHSGHEKECKQFECQRCGWPNTDREWKYGMFEIPQVPKGLDLILLYRDGLVAWKPANPGLVPFS